MRLEVKVFLIGPWDTLPINGGCSNIETKGIGGSFLRVHYGRLRAIFQSLMRIVLIMLKLIKTKSTNVNGVKYIIYIYHSKNYKRTKNEIVFYLISKTWTLVFDDYCFIRFRNRPYIFWKIRNERFLRWK